MEQHERLAAFEQMLAEVSGNYKETVEKMAVLKAQGKEKTATYRQLMGNRLTYKTILSLYQVYGLLEEIS